MYWFLAGILGLLMLIALVLVPHNVRVWRARRAYRQLPPRIIEEVFAVLEEAADRRDAVTFLRPMPGRTCDDPTASRIGGLPYAEPGDAWPPTESEPNTFVVQVHLDDPGLGAPWQGRLIEVFLVFDLEQIVRSYGSPSRTAYTPIQPPNDPVDCIPLRHIRLPKWQETDEGTSWSEQLVRDAPKVRQILSPFVQDVEGLVSQILCPEVYGYRLAEPDVAFAGGEPVLIQNPHDPVCDVCGRAMRFLLQFGDVIPNVQLADAGVCYVYGCDHHPDSCKGYIDSH